MSFRHDDYTVAWICALPLEMAAAKTVLDKVHPSLPQPDTDHNVYTLGNVTGHNVVVACLPSGVYGTTSAAIVLAHMLSTFPSLRFALMVGVGGGVPSKNADIRLGDVVVSMPTAASGGVIQYDYGKTLRDGRLQRTASLNKPPQYLLTAVSHLRSEYMVRDSPIKKGISETLQKLRKMHEQFPRPDQDWLFKTGYDHESKVANCSLCDQSQLIVRTPRETNEPLIYYGLIASGNQVMKNAKIRDDIAQELDILCFEMEAAGLMDQLPCLVIRGVCDYCDSHKNKEWQGYAALTAAAYTAGLLAVVPSPKDQDSPDQKIEFTAVETACLQNLFMTDPTDDRNALRRRKGERAPGTCNWILETDELKDWLRLHKNSSQKESNVLWLYGNPGTGKSTTAITLTEELPNQADFLSGTKRLAYFFCDSSSENQRTATAIIRGLLHQLITQHKFLVKYLLPKYAERKEKLFTSFNALWLVLVDIGQDSSTSGTYCIVDALDECEPDEQEIILQQLDRTFNNSSSQPCSSCGIHFLITSRPYPEVRRYLSSFPHKDLSSYPAVTSDLKIMIRERVAQLSRWNNYPKGVISEVSRILEDKAEGTFLWVGIACNELKRVQARKAVKTLQRLPQGLYCLYQRLFDTATADCDEDDKPVILKLLSFVAIARRPLTIAELSEACELPPDDDEDSRILFTREFIDSCGLIIVAQDGEVRLLHGSVKDFLVKDAAAVNELKSHAALTEQCIASMLQHYQPRMNGKIIGPKSAFLNYSVSFWPEHAGLAQAEFTLTPEQAAFFQLGSKAWQKWLNHYNLQEERRWFKLDPRFSIFHAAARWGIDQLISWGCDALDGGVLIDGGFRTLKGETPLEEGARYGNTSTVGALLQNMSEKEIIHHRVIEAAARNGENGKEILTLLIKERGDQFQITEDVVKAAAGNEYCGHKILTLLLEQQGDQVQITEGVLMATAANKYYGKEVMTLLLEQQGDQFQITEDVVKAAAEYGSNNVMTLLLEQRGDQFQITEDVVEAAAGNQNYGKEIMILLLEQRGDQFQITEGVVKAAAGNEYYGNEILTLLLEQRGDQVQITEGVLMAAAANKYYGKEVMTLLLEQQGDQFQITEDVVKAAAEYGSNDVITLLLEQRGDQFQITEDVVKAAAGNQNYGKEIMILLLEQRGDQFQITEGVVKAAAGNEYYGNEILTLLLEQRGDQVQITEDVVKATAGNEDSGKESISLLLNRRGGQVYITADVLLSAASCGNEIALNLLAHNLGQGTPSHLLRIAQLFKAAQSGDLGKLKQLLSEGTPADTKNIRGVTPLWIAASNGHHLIVKALLQTNQVNVDAKSILGRPPIFWPAAHGCASIVRLLLEAHANPNIADINGDTPYDMAQKYGHLDIAKILQGSLTSPSNKSSQADVKLHYELYHRIPVARVRVYPVEPLSAKWDLNNHPLFACFTSFAHVPRCDSSPEVD